MKWVPTAVFFSIFLFMAFAVLARVDSNNVGRKLPALGLDYVSNAPASTLGKPMIVEFWATWCGPCRQSIPHLNEVYKKYKNRGLVVIGISNEEKETVTKFMKALPMNYSVALDPGQRFSGQFNVSGIPHALLVDSAGRIVWEGHPMSLEASEIDKVLAGVPAVPVPATPSVPAPAPAPAPGPANKKFY